MILALVSVVIIPLPKFALRRSRCVDTDTSIFHIASPPPSRHISHTRAPLSRHIHARSSLDAGAVFGIVAVIAVVVSAGGVCAHAGYFRRRTIAAVNNGEVAA
jgi:hypothetical protein